MNRAVQRSSEEQARIIGCLRSRHTPGASTAAPSAVLAEVLDAYGDMPVPEICRRVLDYASDHSVELRELLARQSHDPRHPALLDDAALPCVLERLEHDRYALRRAWSPRHDPRELRRVADLWGIRLGP